MFENKRHTKLPAPVAIASMHGRGYATFWLAWHKERDLREAACTATVCVPRAPGREMRDGVRLRLPPTAGEVVRA